MLPEKIYIREAVCAGVWYPEHRQQDISPSNPVSTAVISPHAGFFYSGRTSLNAVSQIKNKRVWIFGTSHYEKLSEGISIYPGIYKTSVGKTKMPELSEDKYAKIKKYFSTEGHRTEEHSIENVLYYLNHYREEVNAFCTLVRINMPKDFDKIADDVSQVWEKDDSIIISTDWNHFVSADIINKLMKEVSGHLKAGKIETLYESCKQDIYEACGMDGLFLASKILTRIGKGNNYKILEITDSSKLSDKRKTARKETCVGYLAASLV